MKILVCGASGFVGRHLTTVLIAAGHECRRGMRRTYKQDDVAINYVRDVAVTDWLPRLQGVDVVINAVGILRDTRAQPMRQVLAAAPAALFKACALHGVKRIINVSALGVEGSLMTPYFKCRREAEAVLFALPSEVRWLNLRPSVIYGDDCASAKMFRLMALSPLHVLPMSGAQTLQPVHIDDIAQAVTRWIADKHAQSMSVNATGAQTTTIRGMLDSYRQQLGHGNAVHLSVPAPLVRLGARLGDLLPFSPLCSDTLAMLNAGNTGDNATFAALLGRLPLPMDIFIHSEQNRWL